MVTKQDTPSPVVLTDEFVEQAANMIVTAEDSVKSLAFFQATLSVDDVNRITERVTEIASAKAFAVMLPKLKKDCDNKSALDLHAALESIAPLLVSLTDVKENRVGGGASLEHKISKVETPAGLISVTVKVGELDK